MSRAEPPLPSRPIAPTNRVDRVPHPERARPNRILPAMLNGPHGPPAIHVSAPALEHSQAVTRHLREHIARAGGWLPFHDWMLAVLYAPGLGYYAVGNQKIALRDDATPAGTPAGDFVTAPELSPAFGHTLAQQVAQVLTGLTEPTILEFGAGSGQLAHDVMTALQRYRLSPRYHILEVSADLRARQQDKLARWGNRVTWLDTAPKQFEGVVLANEVLDAMPVHLVGWDQGLTVFERGVIESPTGFDWHDRPANERLTQTLASRMPPLAGYLTELNLAAEAWVSDLSHWLQRGAAFLIDYGFTGSEYFHPQRHRGTLMCHIQHRAHEDPFFAPGLQDITAHVDFSAMARAAKSGGLDVLGFTSQARFLLNAGLPEQLQNLSRAEMTAVQTLVSEAEMGELFKVLAVGRSIPDTLKGFSRGDRRHQL